MYFAVLLDYSNINLYAVIISTLKYSKSMLLLSSLPDSIAGPCTDRIEDGSGVKLHGTKRCLLSQISRLIK